MPVAYVLTILKMEEEDRNKRPTAPKSSRPGCGQKRPFQLIPILAI